MLATRLLSNRTTGASLSVYDSRSLGRRCSEVSQESGRIPRMRWRLVAASGGHGQELPFRAESPARHGADPDATRVSQGARSRARRTPAILRRGSRIAVAAIELLLRQTDPVRTPPVQEELRGRCSSANDCRNALAPAGALRSQGWRTQQAARDQMRELRSRKGSISEIRLSPQVGQPSSPPDRARRSARVHRVSSPHIGEQLPQPYRRLCEARLINTPREAEKSSSAARMEASRIRRAHA